MNKAGLVVVILAVLTAGLGAETLTVDDAVERAVAQNLKLRSSAVDLETQRRARNTVWNAFLTPSLSAGFGSSDGSGGFSDTDILNMSAGLGISLSINAGMFNEIRNLIVTYEGGQITYEDARIKLERDVRKLFYSILANEEGIQIKQAGIDLAQKRLDQARDSYAKGLVPELDVLSAEVKLTGLRPEYDEAVAEYEKLLLSFRFLIGEELDADIELEGNLETELFNLDADELIRNYMPRRLNIQALDKQIEASEHSKMSAALGSLLPSLSIGYDWRIRGSNAANDPWSDWSNRGSFSLDLKWSLDGLIPGSSTDVKIKSLQDSIDKLRISRQSAYTNAEMEIINSVNSLAAFRRSIEASTSSVELARRTYELTEEAYTVGTKGILDVTGAQNDYQSAAQQLLLARYKYIAGLLDLQYSLNTPMDEFLNR